MKKSHRIARKGATARSRAQAEQTARAATENPALMLPKKLAAQLREKSKGLGVEPAGLAATAVSWWLRHAEGDPSTVSALVRHHTGVEPRVPDDLTIDAHAAQIFAAALRSVFTEPDPCRRHDMLSGLYYLSLWNPCLAEESERLGELVYAQIALGDCAALHVADDAEPFGETTETRSLRGPWSSRDSEAHFQQRRNLFAAAP